MAKTMHVLGVDVATSPTGDYLAFAVIEATRPRPRNTELTFRLAYVDRVKGAPLREVAPLTMRFLNDLDDRIPRTDALALAMDAAPIALGAYQDLRAEMRGAQPFSRRVAFRGVLATGGVTSIHKDEHDSMRFNVSRPLLVEPLLAALNKVEGEAGWLDARGLPPEQAEQLAAEMKSYRRDARKGGRLDHDDRGHDDALSAAGSAFWLARELKGKVGGYTAGAPLAWWSADLQGGFSPPRLMAPTLSPEQQAAREAERGEWVARAAAQREAEAAQRARVEELAAEQRRAADRARRATAEELLARRDPDEIRFVRDEGVLRAMAVLLGVAGRARMCDPSQLRSLVLQSL